MTHALEGIKIVDISGIGAYASMILADFGAQVTRVSAIPGTRRGLVYFDALAGYSLTSPPGCRRPARA